MNDDMNATMADALRLTREGRLGEATALLQQRLGGAGQPPQAPPATNPDLSVSVVAPTTADDDHPELLRGRQDAQPSGLPSASGLLEKLQTRLPAGLSGLPGNSTLARPGLVRPGGSAAAAAAASAAGGEIRHLTHTDTAGSRRYDLYIPTSYAGEPVPLIVMLHGGSQDATDFAAGTRMNDLAEQHTFIVAYPEQSTAANNGRYWNWFRPQDQQRDRGEPAILAGITRQVMRDYAVDRSQVYVVGFSAGGAMAAVMAATYPDLYAAVGIHSGLAPRSARDVSSAFEAMRSGGTAGATIDLPLIVFHGDRDNIVAPVNADRLIASRVAASPSFDGGVTPGSSHSRKIYRDINGTVIAEQWIVHGGSHAWFGGSPVGSYTDGRGPDASAEMLRFFLEHRQASEGPEARS
jgi:poly(hydroxyalkanoate) depolymerase family esterase